MRKWIIVPTLLLLIGILWMIGPKAKFDSVNTGLPETQIEIENLESEINSHTPSGIRPDNQSIIFWADTAEQKEFSLLYLHGFSASPMEGDPVHREFARRYNIHCYAPLLAGHGFNDEESFSDITPAQLMSSAAEALAVASRLGEKVIIMSTSTGSTLAVPLAVDHSDLVAGLINFSPNFELADSKSNILTGPWGLQLARIFSGGKYREWSADDSVKLFWTNRYRLEGAVAVKALIQEAMTDEMFSAYHQPVFTGYWFKNDSICDQTISITRIKEFNELISTPDSEKILRVYSEVNAHCMISKYWSEDIPAVQKDIYAFAEKVWGLKTVQR